VQLVVGNLAFPIAGAGVTTSRRAIENVANIPYEEEVTVGVEAWWTGTQQQLILTCAIMERSLKVPRQDLVLFADDGVTAAVRLTNGGSTTGVRILNGPNYPVNGRGSPEFVNRRTVQFTAQASYPLIVGASILLDFVESVGTSGGGAVNDFMLPVNDFPPIPVQTYRQTPYRAFQRGYAVVSATNPAAYASPPAPIFQNALLRAPEPVRTHKRVAAARWELRTEWAYEFGSATPIFGLPNAWR
jgi:hypothetical protein